ncbi:MAG: hypothetical protein QM811_22020 [Pirellulales bacterium]
MSRSWPCVVTLCCCVLWSESFVRAAEFENTWLSYSGNTPDAIVVSWRTAKPCASIVEYGPDDTLGRSIVRLEPTTLHHVEIPLDDIALKLRYRVLDSDKQASAIFTCVVDPGDEFRVAVVANWQGRPKLDALMADRPHLLMTCGDNIADLHRACGVGATDCVEPYAALIAAYPDLFRTTPFMPILGNHDREIRPRGDKPPAEPVYDVEATAFRKFFVLPDDEWKWRFDVPKFGLRFLALDLNHISDQGTTWATCHPLDAESEQLRWYRATGSNRSPIHDHVAERTQLHDA